MADNVIEFLKFIGDIAIYIALGAIASFIFYNIKKRDLFGGYIGGLVVGVIGAVIGGRILAYPTEVIIDFLIRNPVFDVNMIAGFICAYLAVYIMNRLNHDRERKKY